MTEQQTTKRVNVTITFATDTAPNLVLAGVTEELGRLADLIVGTTVNAFDINEPDGPEAQLVLDAGGVRLAGAYVDQPDRAEEHARNIGGALVVLPIAADYRPAAGRRGHADQ